MITLYGIPNCDTVKKARLWLDTAGWAYQFHDFRKDGMGTVPLSDWIAMVGWELLLNRAGTTFRQLPDADKNRLDAARATALMLAQPAMIKRPVVVHEDGVLVGFKPDIWATTLAP